MLINSICPNHKAGSHLATKGLSTPGLVWRVDLDYFLHMHMDVGRWPQSAFWSKSSVLLVNTEYIYSTFCRDVSYLVIEISVETKVAEESLIQNSRRLQQDFRKYPPKQRNGSRQQTADHLSSYSAEHCESSAKDIFIYWRFDWDFTIVALLLCTFENSTRFFKIKMYKILFDPRSRFFHRTTKLTWLLTWTGFYLKFKFGLGEHRAYTSVSFSCYFSFGYYQLYVSFFLENCRAL